MHEATVAFAILTKAAEAISKRFANELANMDDHRPENDKREAGKSGVHAARVKVDIGEFRNVDPESLTFAFQSLRKDLPQLKDAELDIRLVQGLAVCARDHEYRPQPASYFACTVCSSSLKTMVAGEELNITGIELESHDQGKRGT